MSVFDQFMIGEQVKSDEETRKLRESLETAKREAAERVLKFLGIGHDACGGGMHYDSCVYCRAIEVAVNGKDHYGKTER